MTQRRKPTEIERVVLTGRALSREEVVAVARLGVPVALDERARQKVAYARKVVDILVEENATVYGLTTGFGALRTKAISPAQTRQLQRNLIRSHACGVGLPLSEDVVRAVILLRANTLAMGHAGVRAVVLDRLLQLLNERFYPYVPEKGSLGASGDLAPLSHLALVLLGDPAGRFCPPEMPRPSAVRGGAYFETAPPVEQFLPSTPEDLARCGFLPLELEAKEGLALNNGTQVMSAIATLCLYDTEIYLTTAQLAMAMSLEAIKGVPFALQPAIHEVRPLPFQREVAQRLACYIVESQVLALPLNELKWQESLRLLREEITPGLQVYGQFVDSFWTISPWTPKASEDLRALVHDLEQALTDPERWIAGESVDPQEQPRLTPHALRYRLFALAWKKLEARVSAVERQLDFYEYCLYRFREGALDSYPDHLQLVGRLRDSLHQLQQHLQRTVPEMPPVQDDYSFRCAPQVLGCAWRALAHTLEVVEIEINSATDNPLIFPPELDTFVGNEAQYEAFLRDHLALCAQSVLSGGNFHGEPVAMVMDYLAMGIAEVGNISERRTAHLVDEHGNNGLPPFLTPQAGLHSGLMIPQYTAAALVSENKILCHPACVDSIPSSANAEDHVSMGTIAARKCRQVLENAEWVVAIELLSAWQALYFRRPLTPGRYTRKLQELISQAGISPILEDRVLYLDIEIITRLVRAGQIAALDEEPLIASRE